MDLIEILVFNPPLDPDEKKRAHRDAAEHRVSSFFGLAMALGVCRTPKDIPKNLTDRQINSFLVAMEEQRKIYGQDKKRRERRKNSPEIYAPEKYLSGESYARREKRINRAPGASSAQNDKESEPGPRISYERKG